MNRTVTAIAVLYVVFIGAFILRIALDDWYAWFGAVAAFIGATLLQWRWERRLATKPTQEGS